MNHRNESFFLYNLSFVVSVSYEVVNVLLQVMTSSEERRPLSSDAVRRAVSEALGSMSIRVFRRNGK